MSFVIVCVLSKMTDRDFCIVALNYDIEWPAKSPDLTPCDYILWELGNKNEVYYN